MSSAIRGRSALALAAILLVAYATSARAGDTHTELAPELNAYLKLSDRTRLFLLGSVGEDLSDSTTSGQVGAHLDIALMPILRRHLRDGDWERERYLWGRVGYQAVLDNLDDWRDGVTEHRGILELTARVQLPSDVWLVNRARVDLRGLSGDISARLRYRLGIEREFTVVGGVTLVPYAQAEVSYDTRFGAWNRQVYQAGVEIEITRHWRVEPYYARQEDQRSSTAHLDRVGLVLKTYW